MFRKVQAQRVLVRVRAHLRLHLPGSCLYLRAPAPNPKPKPCEVRQWREDAARLFAVGGPFLQKHRICWDEKCGTPRVQCAPVCRAKINIHIEHVYVYVYMYIYIYIYIFFLIYIYLLFTQLCLFTPYLCVYMCCIYYKST